MQFFQVLRRFYNRRRLRDDDLMARSRHQSSIDAFVESIADLRPDKKDGLTFVFLGDGAMGPARGAGKGALRARDFLLF